MIIKASALLARGLVCHHPMVFSLVILSKKERCLKFDDKRKNKKLM